MVRKQWRELTKKQRTDVKKRFNAPFQSFGGNPYIYWLEKDRVVRRHLAYSLESRREMQRLARQPFRD